MKVRKRNKEESGNPYILKEYRLPRNPFEISDRVKGNGGKVDILDGTTLTVGEFIDILKKFDNDMKMFISSDDPETGEQGMLGIEKIIPATYLVAEVDDFGINIDGEHACHCDNDHGEGCDCIEKKISKPNALVIVPADMV